MPSSLIPRPSPLEAAVHAPREELGLQRPALRHSPRWSARVTSAGRPGGAASPQRSPPELLRRHDQERGTFLVVGGILPHDSRRAVQRAESAGASAGCDGASRIHGTRAGTAGRRSTWSCLPAGPRRYQSRRCRQGSSAWWRPPGGFPPCARTRGRGRPGPPARGGRPCAGQRRCVGRRGRCPRCPRTAPRGTRAAARPRRA